MTPRATWLLPRLDQVERLPAGELLPLFERALRGGDGPWPRHLPDPAQGRLVVLGAFGSGKTECSRRIGAALGVPVVPLRVLARAPSPEATLDELLGGADVAILDGLDEIGRPGDESAPAFVERVVRRLRRWVLTSRPAHVRTELSSRDPGQLDAFGWPVVEIAAYDVPGDAPACCRENPVLLSFWLRGARGDTPRALAADWLGRHGSVAPLEDLAWRAFRDPAASVEGASFAAADLVGLPASLFVEDLDGRWRFGHRSLYDALVARRLERHLASQSASPGECADLPISGAMRTFLVGPFPGWTYDEDWVHVPAGLFVSGGARSADERPLVIRHQARPWRLARRAVTNRTYAAFEDACGRRPFALDYLAHWRAFRPAPAILDHPVMYLRPEDADACAAWLGGVLPSAEVWEKAVRGWDGRHFPWGDSFDPTRANTALADGNGPLPVDAHPQGSGLFGAIGDVFETTSSWYRGRSDRGRVVMGGSYAHPPLRASLRLSHTLSGRLKCGLRVAQEA